MNISVSWFVVSINSYTTLPFAHDITLKMMLNVNVFSLRMLNWILEKIYCTSVITFY